MACPYISIGKDGKYELDDDGGYKYKFGCDDDPKVIEYNKMLKEIRKKTKKYYNNVLEEYYLILIILNFLLLKFDKFCISSKELNEAIEKYDACEKMLNHYSYICSNSKDAYKYYINISFLLNTYINDILTQNYYICKCMCKYQNMVAKVNSQYIPYYKFINFVNLCETANSNLSILSNTSKIKKIYLINHIPKILEMLKSHCDENTINIYRYKYKKNLYETKYELFFELLFNCFLDRNEYAKILWMIEGQLGVRFHIYTGEIVIFNIKNIKQYESEQTQSISSYLGYNCGYSDFYKEIFDHFINHGDKIEIKKKIFTIKSFELLD